VKNGTSRGRIETRQQQRTWGGDRNGGGKDSPGVRVTGVKHNAAVNLKLGLGDGGSVIKRGKRVGNVAVRGAASR